MEIYVLDLDANILDMIDTFTSCIWTTQYYSVNDFQLVVAATAKNIDLLQEGRLLCRDKDRNENTWKNVMLIKSIKIDNDTENGDTITVTGSGLKYIVSRRVVWKQTILNGSVEDGIRQIITENIISPEDEKRKMDHFRLADKIGIEDTFDVQVMGDNIAEWMETTCSTYGIGWDVYIDNAELVFQLYKGLDRSYNQQERIPVVFSDDFDNLLSTTYTYEKGDYKNAALIGGEGEGTDQRTTSIGDAQGFDRYETYIDGSSVSSNGKIITEEEYYKMLQDYGKNELSNVSTTETFEGSTDQNGNYVLNKDYFCGDIVQVTNEYGISATPRITEIIESSDENGTSVVPTFSTWEV